MEPMLRELMEKYIDGILKTESLKDLSNTVERFKPFVKSKEDAMLGWIIGSIRATVSTYAWALYHRTPTTEENREITRLTHEQAERIMKRIMESLG